MPSQRLRGLILLGLEGLTTIFPVAVTSGSGPARAFSMARERLHFPSSSRGTLCLKQRTAFWDCKNRATLKSFVFRLMHDPVGISSTKFRPHRMTKILACRPRHRTCSILNSRRHGGRLRLVLETPDTLPRRAINSYVFYATRVPCPGVKSRAANRKRRSSKCSTICSGFAGDSVLDTNASSHFRAPSGSPSSADSRAIGTSGWTAFMCSARHPHSFPACDSRLAQIDAMGGKQLQSLCSAGGD